MSDALLDHLWQSTLFVCAAALLTLAFRKNAASIRFTILLAASLKFLLPFPLLVLLGAYLHGGTTPAVGARDAIPHWPLIVSRIMSPASLAKLDLGATIDPTETSDISAPRDLTSDTTAAEAITRPGSTSAAAPAPSRWVPSNWRWSAGAWILLAWSLGSAVLLFRWLSQWIKLRAVVAAATPLDIEVPIPVREAATTFEPGICGILAPVLLLPQGIGARLTSTELDSVLEHELCHWWRRDNLTAALHMLVATLFWFHPLVWWLGWRLVIERERACDEEVIQSGTERQVYAEAILKVCRLYLEPPLLCAAGVSGGTLRQRIEDIMTNQVGMRLHVAKKCLLSTAAAAAIAGPVAIGLALGPQGLAQAQDATAGNGTQHYQSTEWNFGLDVPTGWNRFPADLSSSPHMEWKFGLDIPQGWNRFPPVMANSPFEVVRFGSGASGYQLLIVFRNNIDAQSGIGAHIAGVEKSLEKAGFGNFVTGQMMVGSKQVTTLDFNRTNTDGTTWSCRQYSFVDGTLVYTLGFGTTASPGAVLAQQDSIAKSFTSEPSTQG
jgi:beta-lactamase regulating signal transducer with metallopeptidase domain